MIPNRDNIVFIQFMYTGIFMAAKISIDGSLTYLSLFSRYVQHIASKTIWDPKQSPIGKTNKNRLFLNQSEEWDPELCLFSIPLSPRQSLSTWGFSTSVYYYLIIKQYRNTIAACDEQAWLTYLSKICKNELASVLL